MSEIDATLFRENMVRADNLPLVLPVLGASELPRGARVRVKLGHIDLVALDVSGTVIERLDSPPETGSDESFEEEGGHLATGPLAIAVDVNEVVSPSGDNPVS